MMASLSGAGLYGASQLKARVKELDFCIRMVQLTADELKYSLTAAEQILDQLCENPLLAGFSLLEDYRQRSRSQPFYLAFEQAICQYQGALSGQDKYILKDLGLILGRYPAESQLHSLENISRRLAIQREQAAACEKTHSRLYRSIGVLGGLAFCLVML